MTDFNMPAVGTWERRGGWVVRRLVADVGLSPEQAAGVVGNLGYESAGFTKLQEISPLVQGSRGGWGWAQWTGSRRVKFEAWCAAHSLAPASDEANYGFLVDELTGAYRSFTASLKQCVSIEDACRLTHKLYETPADVMDGSYRSQPDRLKWARRALAGASVNTSQQVNTPPANDNAADCDLEIDLDLVADLVRALQRVVDVIPDGKFGPKTAAAITEAQRKAA